jgi:hypothetical protein
MPSLTPLLRIAVAASFGGALAPSMASAQAQQAPSDQLALLDEPQQPGAQDPPTRAGRIAQVAGTVSFHGAGADQWTPATVNFPLTGGDALWTEPQARSTVEVSASRVVLDGGTEFDLQQLDAQTLTAAEPQGEVFLWLRDLAPGETYTIQTPRSSVTLAAAGRYEIAAGDTQSPTVVTVLEGSATANGPNLNLQIGPGQAATITGDQSYTGSIGPAQRDAFLEAMLQAERPPPLPAAGAIAPPPVVEAMEGGQELASYGAWQPAPQYGTVWYPQVEPGWTPYRDGHWAYVGRWGWTWVDNAPWGFAPFHYGRWVHVGERWGWCPQYAGPGFAPPRERPVYAPALVAFLGLGAASLSVGLHLGPGEYGRPVGWVPLGFNEPYRPWYHTSPRYIENVNRVNVSNVTNITRITNTTVNNVTINHYANRAAATVVPASALVESRPVAPVVQRLPPQQLAALRPLAEVPVRPTVATAGVTPALAQRLRLPPAPAGAVAPARPVAPGPQIAPVAAHAPLVLRPPVAATRTNAVPGPAIQPGAIAPPRPGEPVPHMERVEPGKPGAVPNAVERTAPERPGAVPAPQAEKNLPLRPEAPAPHPVGPNVLERPGAAPQAEKNLPTRPEAPGPHPVGPTVPERPGVPPTPQAEKNLPAHPEAPGRHPVAPNVLERPGAAPGPRPASPPVPNAAGVPHPAAPGVEPHAVPHPPERPPGAQTQQAAPHPPVAAGPAPQPHIAPPPAGPAHPAVAVAPPPHPAAPPAPPPHPAVAAAPPPHVAAPPPHPAAAAPPPHAPPPQPQPQHVAQTPHPPPPAPRPEKPCKPGEKC